MCNLPEKKNLLGSKNCFLKELRPEEGMLLRKHRDYEARHDYTNNSETILLRNRCVCAIGKLIPRQLVCVCVCNWHIHRKYLMETPYLHKRIPARKPCATDVLWN